MRSRKEFVCRHCAYHVQAGVDCPHCHKPSWRSFGMGVEQLQKEISALFPTARIVHFEKGSQGLPAHFDVLIATQAVLRFQGRLNVQTIVFVDLDAELSRMNMHSSFKGWSLVMHVRLLGQKILIQTRNPGHHVLKALATDSTDLFYGEEMRLRRELDFSPFYHWIAVVARSKTEKFAQTFAGDMYNVLSKDKPEGMALTPVQPDVPAKVRDQYRFRIMAGGKAVVPVMHFIKERSGKVKRNNRVIVTLNVDP